jgi:outer membrane receptor for ferrienterochelin and colicins
MVKCKKARARLAAIVLTACWAVIPLSASAAEEGDKPQEFALPEVITTATRTEQTVKDTPSTVQVIKREDIELRQNQTLGDVLKDAMGVTVFKDFQGRSQFRIRGSESRHVLLMIDGRRIGGELSFNSANAQEMDRIRMDNVERVEIIRGPAGALYGSDAMGGVVNVITKKPTKNEGRLLYEYAAWDGMEKAGPNMQFYYQGVNDAQNFAWSVSAAQHKPRPFFLEDGTTANYYGKEQPIALSGTYTFNNGNHLKVEYSKLWEELDSNTIFKSMHPKMPDIPQNIRNDDTRTDWSLEYGGKDAKQDWQVRAYRSKYDKDYSSYSTVKMGPGPAQTYLSKFDLVERTISVLEGRNSWHVGDNHLMTAGLEWRKDESEGTRIKKPNSLGKPVSYGKLKGISDGAAMRYRAFYIQDEIKAGQKLLMIPSLRYDWSDKFDSQLTPRLGITYKVKDDMRIKGVIGKGYKTPTVNELYHNWEMFKSMMGDPGEYWKGNPDLQPEKSTDYEISLEKDWDKTSARMGLFRNDVKDLLADYWNGEYININGSKDKLMRYRNVDQATIQGFESEVSHNITDALKLRLGYLYLDAKDKQLDRRLEGRPRHQINVGITYRPLKSSWNINLDLVTLRDMLKKEGSAANTRYITQSYSIVNMMAEKNMTKDAMFYIGVDNLTDYTDYGHGNVGRVYRSGVQYKF